MVSVQNDAKTNCHTTVKKNGLYFHTLIMRRRSLKVVVRTAMLLVATIVTCVAAHATPYTTADNPSSPADRGATHEVTTQATDTTVRAGAIHTHLIRTEIHFRWDDTTLDTLYMGNYKAFARLRRAIDAVGLRNLDSIIIVSQSSPEGPFRHNQELSQGRAASI